MNKLTSYIKKLSKTSVMHYIKLFVRASFFITATVLYILGKTETTFGGKVLPAIIWVWYFVEMICRLFPTGMESMGCEKVFKKNYHPPKVEREPKNQSAKTTFITALAWFILNGAIFALHFIFPNFVTKQVLALIALAYGVCDIICILFFCPFQTWFMKNRCCTTCRIYNWDFAMLCTPFLLIPSLYTYSLLGLALIILAKWEITYKLHPERFSERTNESLRCKNCTEKLCKHKVQLQHYIKKHKDILFESYEKAKDITVETYGKVKNITTETYGKVKDITTEAYGKVIDKTAETISAVVDKTVDTYEWAKELTTETYGKVKDVAKETYSKVTGKNKEIVGTEKSSEMTEGDAPLGDISEPHPTADQIECVDTPAPDKPEISDNVVPENNTDDALQNVAPEDLQSIEAIPISNTEE